MRLTGRIMPKPSARARANSPQRRVGALHSQRDVAAGAAEIAGEAGERRPSHRLGIGFRVRAAKRASTDLEKTAHVADL